MPRTSKGRRSQGPESDTSPESKSEHSLMRLDCRTYDSTPSWLTQLPPEIVLCLDYGGSVAISRQDGSISVTLFLPLPIKAAP